MPENTPEELEAVTAAGAAMGALGAKTYEDETTVDAPPGSSDTPVGKDEEPWYAWDDPSGIPWVMRPELIERRRREALARARQMWQPRGSGLGIRFDQALVSENIRDEWRFLMLEEPDNLQGLVAEYMGQSRSQGMMLNLNAWILQRARREGRYHLLYSRKPAELSEQEYIGQLRGVAEQVGLSGRAFNREVTSAAASGQSQAGFQARAQGVREVRVNNIGLYSRKVAQAFAGLGALGRGG